jgi:hypothetical protein
MMNQMSRRSEVAVTAGVVHLEHDANRMLKPIGRKRRLKMRPSTTMSQKFQKTGDVEANEKMNRRHLIETMETIGMMETMVPRVLNAVSQHGRKPLPQLSMQILIERASRNVSDALHADVKTKPKPVSHTSQGNLNSVAKWLRFFYAQLNKCKMHNRFSVPPCRCL